MQLVLFTSNDKFRSEIYIVIKMLENGLETLHIKKPNFSKKQMTAYINQIPEKYHRKLIIHSFYSLIFKYNLKGIHISKKFRTKTAQFKTLLFLLRFFNKKKHISCSCHSIEQLLEIPKFYSYVLLTPVFNHHEMNAKFSKNTLENIIPQVNFDVYASGGINLENMHELESIGFKGVSLMGSIWFNDDKQPLANFIDSKNKLTMLS